MIVAWRSFNLHIGSVAHLPLDVMVHLLASSQETQSEDSLYGITESDYDQITKVFATVQSEVFPSKFENLAERDKSQETD